MLAPKIYVLTCMDVCVSVCVAGRQALNGKLGCRAVRHRIPQEQIVYSEKSERASTMKNECFVCVFSNENGQEL